MRNLLLVAPLAVLVAAAGGCAGKARPNDRPDLMIPAPPPHVIPINSEPILEPVADLPVPTNAPPAGRGAARGTREASPKPSATDNKPEAKPGGAETKPPEPPTQPEPALPSTPAPQLRTAESSAAEGTVRASLDRTKNLLANVDYRFLSNARKKAYDDAKRFMRQAEDSLKAGNAVFAQGVATKAETLARELANR